jgi:hypothetical protein
MKKYKSILTLLLSISCLGGLLGQTNKKTLNYQAVILDPKAIDIPGASIVGQPLNKGNVCLRFSLLNAQGGLDYEETQQVTTDEYGLVNVAIGAGAQAQASNSTSIYKSFDSVMWNSSVKSLKVSVSYDACSSFKQVSSQALNYTPYALYAEAVDYKNVRDAPTKLSQFSNDPGFLIPKDLDPLKADITSNTSQLATANQTIADNKKNSDATFLVVNQSLTSLDKQVSANTSTITTMNTKITDQQNQIVDNRNQITATSNSLNTQIGGLQGQLNTTNSTVSNLTGTAEVVSNKSTETNLGGANPSDQAYPSQKAAKTYVDQLISQVATSGVPDATTLASGKIQLSGDLGGTAASPTVPALASKENSNNKSLSVQADGTNDTKYPSVKAVKTYVDQATMGTALQATVDGKADKASPIFSGTPVLPTETIGVTQSSADNSTKLATTAFVQQATAGIALQASVDAKADKNSPTFTGTPVMPSGTIAVTQTPGDNSTNIATTAFVQQSTAAGIIDASSSIKGKLKLSGDLGGTADAPTVPGLALKANSTDVTSSLAIKEDASNKSNAALGTSTTLFPTQSAVKTYVDAQIASATISDADAVTKGKLQLAGDLAGTAAAPTVPGLALKANTSDVTNSLALKAPINNPTFTGTVGGITQSMVGLANIDNTSDANKPVSTAAQTALNLKAPLASPTFTGTPSLPTGTIGVTQSAGDNSTKLATTEFVTTSLAAGAPDATTTATGKVQLAGDLAGTAAAPTVPGLALKANTTDVTNSLALKAPIESPTFTGTVGGITQSMVGLANIDNTSDANKPVSTAAQSALDLKAPLTSPSFTGTPSLPTGTTGVTQSAGDNSTKLATTEFVTTSLAAGAPDATTTATGKVQLAGDLAGTAAAPTVPGLALKANTTDVTNSLALKAPINNPTFTGTVGGITQSMVGLANVDNTSDANKPVSTAAQTALDLKAPLASPTFTGTVSGITKMMVGLANVDNTTDANKPVSTAAQTALDLKAPIASPTFTGTVVGITKSMVDLANVDNTSDANKPVSAAAQTALNLKATLASPTLTGTPLAPTATSGTNTSQIATTEFVNAAVTAGTQDATTSSTGKLQLAGDLAGTASSPTVPGLALKAPIDNPTFSGTVAGISKTMVGLANVDNTTDANKPVSTSAQSALDLKAPLASPTFKGTVAGITKSMVDLANVDNTTDANKPVSTSAQTALDLKAPLASPTFTGTVGGITKNMVDLANVDNTTDANKPVSTSAQTALDLKAPINNPTFTGTVGGITKGMVDLANVDNTTDANKPVSTAAQTALDLKAPLASPTFTGTVSGISQSMVGLGNVNNTSDADKPVSSAAQSALDLKAPLASPTFTGTVSGINKSMVGLANVDNTSDANKSVSLAAQTALDLKANSLDVTSSLALKATLASPTFTGTPSLPTETTAFTQTIGDNSTKLATTEFVMSNISTGVAEGAPNATTTATGKVQLAGDLAGTATAPTVPGLASKANTTDVTNSLALKAPLASPTFTGTVGGITKNMIGLPNVDNTSDANKPVSTAAQTALNLKATLASPTFTGTPSLPTETTAFTQTIGDNSTKLATTEFVMSNISTGVAEGAPNATTTATGKVQLAGDLAGTATAPTVPGLASKANTTDVTNSLALKAPLASPTFTGTVGGITKNMIGLPNVDNTSDANKPVSTAAQTALNLKATLASPTLTGTPLAPTATSGTNTSQIATTEFVNAAVTAGTPDATTSSTGKLQLAGDLGGTASSPTVPGLALKAPIDNPTFSGTVAGISKTMVGLANVDNTTDANKPVSTSAQTALDLKAPLASPTFTGTVGGITKSMVDLANVDNTTDANKPVSTSAQTALDLKAPLASPTFTGTPSLPSGTTAFTQTVGDNSTKLATTEFVMSNISTGVAAGVPNATTIATGKVQLAGDLAGTATAPVIATGVITSAKILDATIVTADLADNSITSVKIADGAITNTNISSAAAIADTKLTTIATAGKVSNSATTATSANTASTIVARDASGNFNAGTITANLTGNVTGNLTGNAANVTGTIAAANGGTGQTSYTMGDLLYASTSTAVSKLADVATGNALISGGVGAAPSYGKISLTTTVSGALPVANGGTGQTSYTIGDLLYASTSTAVAKLADVATGNALISKGINTAPSYGKIDLTTTVSGTLPVANGGTGATALVANSVLLGNGTSTLQTIAPGTTGNVLTSNGSTWTSAAATGPTYTYSIGLNASLGGYVFYVTPDKKHGLVAETQDQCSACNWADAINEISRPANHSTNGKGFTDWRLPTRYEIIVMFQAKSDTWWTGVIAQKITRSEFCRVQFRMAKLPQAQLRIGHGS